MGRGALFSYLGGAKLETIKERVSALSGAEWPEFLAWVIGPEKRRRDAAPAVDAAQADLVRDLRDSGVIDAPEGLSEWVNPGTDHAAMYLVGDRARHGGRVWESTHPGLNSWEPGAPGVPVTVWREVGEPGAEDAPADDAAEAVPEGDGGPVEWAPGQRVQGGDVRSHGGATWRALQAHETALQWPPEDSPSLWEKVA